MQHSTMPRRLVCTAVELLQKFKRDRIVSLWGSGWKYRRIAAHIGRKVSVVCRYFEQLSQERSHGRRSGSGRPQITDARQDRRIVRAAVTIRSSREEIQADDTPPVSSRRIGNSLSAAELRSRVPLARLPLTPRHC